MPITKDLAKKYLNGDSRCASNSRLLVINVVQAITKRKEEGGKLPQYYLEYFTFLRNFSDELPTKRVDFLDTDYYVMKCRGGVIITIARKLQFAIDEGIMRDSALVLQIEAFKKHDWNYVRGKYTSKEEIALINAMLDTVIEYLKTTYSLE